VKGRAALVVGALGVAGVQLSTWGCSDDVLSHPYNGEQLDETGACLEPVQSIDVVTGDEPSGTCKPICILSQPDDTVPQEVFVSSMCAPYPAYPYIVNPANDPRCTLAIEAFNHDTLCDFYDGGGTLNPFDAAMPDAAEAGTPDAADAATPDAGDATTPDAGDATTPDAADAATPDAADATTPDAADATTLDAADAATDDGEALESSAGD
jgi:hypothetical protein